MRAGAASTSLTCNQFVASKIEVNMKLITSPKELIKEFKQLIEEYDNFYWATAWASKNFDIFDELLKNKSKIQKIVVGIHFYQTHPDFIKEFLDDDRVRFTEQPDGTFHPKLYLFTKNSGEWALIIGSANFTKAAFEKNAEASLLVTHKDNNSNGIHTEALHFIEEKFCEGEIFSETDIENYRSVWKNKQKQIENLSGQYGELYKKSKSKPIYKNDIITRNWDDFVFEVKKEKHFKERLKVIDFVRKLFKDTSHFNELEDDKRKFIAGVSNKLNEADWKLFGSMTGNGIFVNRVMENDSNISKALDEIPLFGLIEKTHYDNFIETFKKSFIGTKLENANNLGTATRLLCMKRPDIFICLDSENKSKLCKSFEISQKIDYEKYWDIIEMIYDSDWYQNPKPKDEQERKISEARAAFLDSLFYEGKY
jgi:HKD family nuclease